MAEKTDAEIFVVIANDGTVYAHTDDELAVEQADDDGKEIARRLQLNFEVEYQPLEWETVDGKQLLGNATLGIGQAVVEEVGRW